jgi:tRNA-specific 2-thiouridylase
MRTPEGRVLGEHVGLAFYTLGQRKGIGVGGVRGGAEDAWYVAAKDMENNELIVVQGHDHPLLLSRRLEAVDLAWVGGAAPRPGAKVAAKTRYRQADAACVVASVSAGRMELAFNDNQWAATPGQSAVLYDGEVCLGGGVIDRAHAGAVSANEGRSQSLA